MICRQTNKNNKKNSENVNNKKYARNNLEKFFASNEMREHLNQKFTKKDTDSLNRKIQENEKNTEYNSRELKHS